MYELNHITGNSYYIQSPSKMGLVKLNDTDVCLIDSGNDKDAGRKVRQLLDANGWHLTAIYNTHSNADHIGGNRYLQGQTKCKVYAQGIECDITRHPVLEPAFLYGGFPPKDLRHKFLMAQESDAQELTPGVLPESFALLQLPGHFFHMVGFRSPDDVVYLADCLSSRETMDALLGVGQRVLKGSLGDTQCLCRDTDAAAVQRGHGDLEAVALLAQQVLLGDLHVVEDQLRRGGGANSHLVVVVAELKALPALLHDEGGDAAGADVRRGDGENHIGVRLGRVGDEDLAAVEQVVVALVQRRGLRAAGVRPGVRLGEAEGAQLFASCQRHEILLLLLLRAVGEDGPRAQRHVGGEDHACAAIHTGQLLHRHGVAENVKARAAVFLGEWQPQPAQLSHLLNSLVGKLVVLIQQEGKRLDLLLRKGPDLGAQLLVRGCGLKQHTVYLLMSRLLGHFLFLNCFAGQQFVQNHGAERLVPLSLQLC